jgi:hypothetical protein
MEFGEILAQFLSGVVFPLILAIVLILIGKVARKIDKKYDIELFQNNLHLLEDLARNAAMFAEERAAAWAKQKKGVSSSEKLNDAVKWMLKQAPQLSDEEARDYIEAVLPGLYAGIGATNHAQSDL